MLTLCTARGMMLFIATHDQELAGKIDTVIPLKDGKMETRP